MIKVDSFTFNPIQENTYALSNEKGDALIIDPGCYFTEEEETLESYIKQNNLKPFQLLNTHCHLDHVFGNRWVAKKYNLELFIHPLEEKLLQMAPASASMFGLEFDNYKGKLHFLNPGDTIRIGNDEMKVIFAPGHSPGSICFYCAKQNFIIAGDVLFFESIGRTDLPGGNHLQLSKSIKEQLFTLPGETTVYSGHGPQTTIGHEKEFNPFLNE
jgi:glyoxylase-like metal-dependent hydrolase (beta-lactamase superfamily II)